MSLDQIKQVFTLPGVDRTFESKAEAMDYLRRPKVIEALNKTDYTGVTGNVKFDADRNPTKSVTIIQIVNGAYKFSGKVNP